MARKSFGTPNGHKVSIALEELGLPYRVHPVHIGRGEQDAAEFRRINPNGKIPAIVDQEGITSPTRRRRSCPMPSSATAPRSRGCSG